MALSDFAQCFNVDTAVESDCALMTLLAASHVMLFCEIFPPYVFLAAKMIPKTHSKSLTVIVFDRP